MMHCLIVIIWSQAQKFSSGTLHTSFLFVQKQAFESRKRVKDCATADYTYTQTPHVDFESIHWLWDSDKRRNGFLWQECNVQKCLTAFFQQRIHMGNGKKGWAVFLADSPFFWYEMECEIFIQDVWDGYMWLNGIHKIWRTCSYTFWVWHLSCHQKREP